MAFIKFPVYFLDDDENTAESKANLGLAPDQSEGIISVNTECISAYHENSQTKNTMIRLNSGDVIECPVTEAEFEKILSSVERIFTITQLCEN